MVLTPISFIVLLILTIAMNGITAAQVGTGITEADFAIVKSFYLILTIIAGVFTATSEIIGFLALGKLKSATAKNQTTVLSILTLIFCSLVGGILMLCIPDTEFKAIN